MSEPKEVAMRWLRGWDWVMFAHVSFTAVALATCVVAIGDVPHTTYTFIFHMLAVLSAALLCGVSTRLARERRRHLWAERKAKVLHGLVPVSVDSMGVNEATGARTLAITRRNGTVVTVEMPADYHPAQDGGRLLMETLLPEEELDALLGIPTTVRVYTEADDGSER